ncbi:GTP pyrophosphokinase [Thiohalomonas denitrificans]|uniref:PpGpp synthetase catalytic domain-containing protein (RelA/SpoT-type nucleotidyltranferase) n=1 Tax=Thiohalomonas denitrificans TaxID=415747 RepID=A0A1G5QSC2_9GAMM|nr:GTP pyrophosphokinase [Thiohalomonas denitrificans]SCZ64753.1 ppGpp synthetase catalytic domain-containing protein (RelA/SpoT-type nucleotidyltranferase) [Thiohalomonas denitrificans]
MSEKENEKWLSSVLPLHRRLTESVVTIIENVLKAKSVDFLAVSGRTKEKTSALEKIERKGYRNPQKQMTDLSGVRVILYFESDVNKASEIIDEAFEIDPKNSLNQDDLMSTDQIGYRSVHFVCGLGNGRTGLPEFSDLAGLQFEIQVRTVLQHAWAELAHDRNYKFSGKLPKRVERQLYLYAGMLEIADRGFDDVSKEIDKYIESVERKSDLGELDVEIDSISLPRYVRKWCEENGIEIDFPTYHLDELVKELHQFGIHTLAELDKVVPPTYAEVFKREKHDSNIFGVVRDWMLIHDWKRFAKNVERNWCVSYEEEENLFHHFFSAPEFAEFHSVFCPEEVVDEEFGDESHE